MFNNELDVLEMRLTELQEIEDLRHVLIEAPINHQGREKELWYSDNRERFSEWEDRIIRVIAEGLPSAEQDPNPWSREHAQRECARQGLSEALPGDIVLHGDVDEIPREWAARMEPGKWGVGARALSMRHHFWAVDWQHPDPWTGTVVTRLERIVSFAGIRMMRNSIPLVEDAGWHISALGGPEAIRGKLDSFCHLEMRGMLEQGLAESAFFERGLAWGPDGRLGGTMLRGVDVDEGWPRWIREGHAPASWFRPRTDVAREL
jgi:beta-1,4-mannosyl-glycoprotein beta-1,4-N-acetylglucosaminyltransferase